MVAMSCSDVKSAELSLMEMIRSPLMSVQYRRASNSSVVLITAPGHFFLKALRAGRNDGRATRLKGTHSSIEA